MESSGYAASATVRSIFRGHTRAVAFSPGDTGRHLARLHAALQMPGSEPVQGALADLYVALPGDAAELRKAALQLAVARLNPYTADAFARQSTAHASMSVITPLATRWSVIAQPSADVPARVRRGGSDDSRRLAQQVVDALTGGEPIEAARIEEAFLGHCASCQDKLAFMLAMRGFRRAGIEVDERWARMATWLEQFDAYGGQQPGGAGDPRIDP